MEIHYHKEIISNLGVGYLFIDTCTLILVTSYLEQFGEIISQLEQQGKVLVTIPSVAFEFTRTNNVESYNTRARFLNNHVSIYPIEKHLGGFNALTPVVQKINPGASYSDFLLYCCLYKFNQSHLLTENHKDFTTALLNRETILTVDTEKQIRNTALYSFSMPKYEKIAAQILEEY